MKYFVLICLLLTLQACDAGKDTNSDASSTVAESENETNELPPIPVQMTDGTTQQMDDISGKSILVLYQPGCDHCQREATSIEENLTHFEEYQVYFISSASIYESQQFASTYKLSNASNFHFGVTSPDQVVKEFGSIPTPSLYVYSAGGKLLHEFIGETPIEKILEVL